MFLEIVYHIFNFWLSRVPLCNAYIFQIVRFEKSGIRDIEIRSISGLEVQHLKNSKSESKQSQSFTYAYSPHGGASQSHGYIQTYTDRPPPTLLPSGIYR